MASAEVLLPDDSSVEGSGSSGGSSGGAAAGGRQPKSWRELARLTWPLVACTMVLGLHKEVDTQLFQPYFYTRVECCAAGEPPLPNHVGYGVNTIELSVSHDSCNCDVRSSYPSFQFNESASEPPVIDACAVPLLPKENPLWSHSRNCRNFLYVQMEAQTLSTTWNMITAASAIVCLPIGGRFADLYGRRLVFFWGTAAAATCFWIFTADGLLGLGDIPIYLTGLGIGAFQCLQPVQWAMAIDLVPDPIDQARFFPLMAAITNGSVASIVGEALAYLCLSLYLDDYTIVWAILSLLTVAVCVFLWFVLPETLAHPKQWIGWGELLKDMTGSGSSSGGGGSQQRNTGGYAYGTLLWCRGSNTNESGGGSGSGSESTGASSSGAGARSGRRILIISFTAAVIGAFFSNGTGRIQTAYMLNNLHMQQQEVVVQQAVGKVATILATPAAMVLLPKLGPWLASVLGAVGYMAPPLLFVLLGSVGPYVAIAVGSVTDALRTSASQMYIAAVLRSDDQAKAQSSLNLFTVVSNNLGQLAYTAVFYGDAKLMTTGYVTSATVGIGLLLMTAAYPRTLPPPPGSSSSSASASRERKPTPSSAAAEPDVEYTASIYGSKESVGFTVHGAYDRP